MRKLFTICVCTMIVFVTEAQKPKKPSLTKAKSLWEQGVLDEAKSMIDEATTYEKTMDDGKTWYYRGLIYASLDTTTNIAYEGIEPNALDIALQSFAKARELDESEKSYYVYGAGGLPVLMEQQISGYYNYYFNSAVANYEQEFFDLASIDFETAWRILPADTTSIVNAGFAALINEDSDRAMDMFEKSLETGATSINIYYNMISALRIKEDQDAALKVVQRAKVKYPSDNNLNRQEISILMAQGKAEIAKDQLIAAIKNEPTDPALRFALGLLYEGLEQEDKAIETYVGSIEVKPDHYESNFNLSVILFNKAKVLYTEKASLGISAADQKKAKELDPKIKEGFSTALKAWEKTYAIKNNERPTLETMLFLYAYLGEEKKADKIENELNALGNE